MVDSLDELAHGKEYAMANRKFRTQIKALNEKYPDVLEKGDTFERYFVMTNNFLPGKVTFKIHDDAGKVPAHIRKEMKDIFRNNFDPKLNHSTD